MAEPVTECGLVLCPVGATPDTPSPVSSCRLKQSSEYLCSSSHLPELQNTVKLFLHSKVDTGIWHCGKVIKATACEANIPYWGQFVS